MLQYLTPRDVIFFIGIFSVVFVVFRHYPIVEVKTTICTLLVMWIFWHWHVHARDKSMAEMAAEIDELKSVGISLQSILEMNDPKLISIIHELLRFSPYNEVEFENGMIHVENFLRLYLDVVKRGVVYSAHHTENAKMQKTKALNAFMGIMSSLPMNTNNELGQHFDILQNPLDLALYRIVHSLENVLESYLREMAKVSTKKWNENPNIQEKPVYLNRPEPAGLPLELSSDVFV